MPEVSLHTAVKGQFGLGTGRAMGKALKAYVPRYVSRQGVEETEKESASAGCASFTGDIFHEYLASPLGNVSYRERSWLQACEQSHSSFCGCGDFILHLSNLAARFALQGPPPSGGPPRPRPPLLRALPAPEARRETRTENPGASGEPWPGDGGGRDDGAAARGPADDGDAYDAGDLDDLFAAVEEEQQ